MPGFTVMFGEHYDSNTNPYYDPMCTWYFAYHNIAKVSSDLPELGETVIKSNDFVRRGCGRFLLHYQPEDITIKTLNNEIIEVKEGDIVYTRDTAREQEFPELGKFFVDPINNNHAIAITKSYKNNTYFNYIKRND